MSLPNPNAISSISVLAAAGARPVTVFGPEDDEDEHGLYQERTPLNSANNSPEGRKSVAARSGKAPSAGGVDAKSQITARRAQHEMNLARNEAQAYAEENDARKSMTARIARIIFLFGPLIDAALLYVLGSDPLPQQAIDFGQNMRATARAAQITAMCFTLFLGLYSLYVINAWNANKPRFATIASKQFRLLPEYKVISLVLDVGKLAYPSGLRVPLVALLMVVRVVEFILVLRLTFLMRLATQLTDTKQLPEMLRTLLSLDGEAGTGEQIGRESRRRRLPEEPVPGRRGVAELESLDRLKAQAAVAEVGPSRFGVGGAAEVVGEPVAGPIEDFVERFPLVDWQRASAAGEIDAGPLGELLEGLAEFDLLHPHQKAVHVSADVTHPAAERLPLGIDVEARLRVVVPGAEADEVLSLPAECDIGSDEIGDVCGVADALLDVVPFQPRRGEVTLCGRADDRATRHRDVRRLRRGGVESTFVTRHRHLHPCSPRRL